MIPLSDIKAWLGIDTSVTTDDALLIDLEGRAVAFVQRITGRYFGANGSTTEVLWGSDMGRLYLLEPPTNTSTQALTVTYTLYPGGTSNTITATAADGFEVRTEENEGWLVRYGGNVWDDEYEYTVGYRRGYTVTASATASGAPVDLAVPGEIRQLVLDLIALKYRLRKHEGAISETIDNYSYRYADFVRSDLDAIPGWKSVEMKWRRINTP